jgi:DNA-binding protein YbaB
MFEDEVLKQFLAKAVEDAKKEIKDTDSLTIKNAIPLLLHF